MDLVLDDIGCVSVVSLGDVGAVEVGGAGEQMEEGGVENSTKGIWLVFAGGSGGLVFWVPCVHFFSRFLMIIITIARVMTSAQTKNHIKNKLKLNTTLLYLKMLLLFLKNLNLFLFQNFFNSDSCCSLFKNIVKLY